jgi:hypothetical protein
MTDSDQPKPVGRPSSFKPEFVEQANKLCKLGATDPEIADFFGVSRTTINNWKHDHPEFLDALKSGKESADERVERSLYQRAIGYTQDAVKIFMPAGADAPVYAPFVENVVPDTTAAIFWLKNRRPDQWRDKTQQEVTGANGAPLVPIINLTGRPEPASAPEAVGGVRDTSD